MLAAQYWKARQANYLRQGSYLSLQLCGACAENYAGSVSNLPGPRSGARDTFQRSLKTYWVVKKAAACSDARRLHSRDPVVHVDALAPQLGHDLPHSLGSGSFKARFVRGPCFSASAFPPEPWGKFTKSESGQFEQNGTHQLLRRAVVRPYKDPDDCWQSGLPASGVYSTVQRDWENQDSLIECRHDEGVEVEYQVLGRWKNKYSKQKI